MKKIGFLATMFAVLSIASCNSGDGSLMASGFKQVAFYRDAIEGASVGRVVGIMDIYKGSDNLTMKVKTSKNTSTKIVVHLDKNILYTITDMKGQSSTFYVEWDNNY